MIIFSPQESPVSFQKKTETLLELYTIPLVLLFPAVIMNREELNGCSTLRNLTQLILGMLGHPAWPAQNISPIKCLQQHPWTGTPGRVITNYVHKTFPQALSKVLIIFCSGSSDIVSCLVTQRSFFEIFFYSSLQPVGFILFIFWWRWQENIQIGCNICLSGHWNFIYKKINKDNHKNLWKE